MSLATTGTYYWQASYSGSTLNLPSTSPCTAETESVTSGQTGTALSTYLDGDNGSAGLPSLFPQARRSGTLPTWAPPGMKPPGAP